MRSVMTTVCVLAAALPFAACGRTSLSGSPAYSSAPGSANQVPQSPNSLPAGALVTAPLTPNTGTLFRSGY